MAPHKSCDNDDEYDDDSWLFCEDSAGMCVTTPKSLQQQQH